VQLQAITTKKFSLLFLFALGAVLVPCSKADPVHFGGIDFVLTNTNADGSASVSSDVSTLSIVGPNNGSGEEGTTDLVATAAADGTVTFTWSYSSADDPQADAAGYLLDGVYTQLADTGGQSGSTQFAVSAGQSFGFEVNSQDNQGEPGILEVSGFSAPQAAATPEPATWGSLIVGAAIFLGVFKSSRGLVRVRK
jgi:hypothetical protein